MRLQSGGQFVKTSSRRPYCSEPACNFTMSLQWAKLSSTLRKSVWELAVKQKLLSSRFNLTLSSRQLSSTSLQLSLILVNSRRLLVSSRWLWSTYSHLVQYSWFKLTFFHELDTEQSILCTQAHPVSVYDRRTKCLLDLNIGLDDLFSLVHLLYITHEVTNKHKKMHKSTEEKRKHFEDILYFFVIM